MQKTQSQKTRGQPKTRKQGNPLQGRNRLLALAIGAIVLLIYIGGLFYKRG